MVIVVRLVYAMIIRLENVFLLSEDLLANQSMWQGHWQVSSSMKLPSDPEDKSPFTTCDSTCLAYCYCKAYAYDGNRCLIWTSDIFNLQQLDVNNSEGKTLYVRVLLTSHQRLQSKVFIFILSRIRFFFWSSWESSYLGDPKSLEAISRRTKHRKVRTIVLAVVLPTIAFFIGLYCYFSFLKRSKKAQKGEIGIFISFYFTIQDLLLNIWKTCRQKYTWKRHNWCRGWWWRNFLPKSTRHYGCNKWFLWGKQVRRRWFWSGLQGTPSVSQRKINIFKVLYTY